jgi:hypothetical protein
VGSSWTECCRSLSATVWPSLVSASAGILLFAIAEAGHTQSHLERR